MSEERLYYIKSLDQWLTYEEAHSYGLTKKKPIELTFYTEELQPVIIRKDTDTNELWDFREEVPHEWHADISELAHILYKCTGGINLYMGDVGTTYVGYSTSAFSDIPTLVANPGNASLVEISWLYENRGITDHPCINYYISEGVILVWYDPDTALYWDNQPGRKHWSGEPPRTDYEEANTIPMYPNPVLQHEQWLYDLSQMPEVYRSYGNFSPSHETVELVTTFKSWNQWDLESKSSIITHDGKWHPNYQPTVRTVTFDEWSQLINGYPYNKFYTDTIKKDVTFYVIKEDGCDDYAGNHHDFADTFTGDYEEVWVDSDADVTFWRGSTKYTFGQSHDDDNPVIYWCSSVYMIYEELYAGGYTLTRSIDVEIWDSNLLGRRLWEDT